MFSLERVVVQGLPSCSELFAPYVDTHGFVSSSGGSIIIAAAVDVSGWYILEVVKHRFRLEAKE